MPPYVELHARSAFSFLRGASQPEPLVERAAQLDLPALALCDRDGLYGAPRLRMGRDLWVVIASKDRPMQLIFAGKAHPKDHGGKELIAEIMQFARRPELRPHFHAD